MKNLLFLFFALFIGIFLPLRSTAQVLNLEGGSTYAVVVGISDYQDDGIPDLRFADKDAEAFANFLRSPAGGELDENHLKLMTNEEVTLGQFDAALWWLVDECKEGDKVIIYFSGHGDVERRSRSQLGFLLCWDAPPLAYTGGGTFPIYFLKEIISTLSLQNKAKVTLITDACRSGKLAGSSIGGAQATAANLATQYANEIKILSCQPDEYSIEGEQWGGGRGAFSYHLIDGLYGMADGNQDLSVSLMEIGRYLQDKVTMEVEPQSQVLMTVGNFKEKLAAVSPETLEKLKQSKQGLVPQFNTISTRGIEEEILASVDSTVQEQFYAFQQALDDKVFLSPANTCADFYYKQLIKEPKLEKLHNSMRRNYAAALQDDTQQVLKKMLGNDPSEMARSKAALEENYKPYPAYLERAAELLGSEHYIYPFLQARKLYFEGYLMHIDLRNSNRELGMQILEKYREALTWQPNFPQVYFAMEMVHFYQMLEPDSAAYYAGQAVKLAPTWVRPYSDLSFYYLNSPKFFFENRHFEKAKYFLELTDQVDSTASLSDYIHINNWGTYYYRSGQLEKAALTYKKAIELDSSRAWAQNNLGAVYDDQRNLAGAEVQFKKTIKLDSTNRMALTNLGKIYLMSNRIAEAEVVLKKSLTLDSTYVNTLSNLGMLYLRTGRLEEGEKKFLKCVELDSITVSGFNNLGNFYFMTEQYEKAEKYIKKGIHLDSTFSAGYESLGRVYFVTGRMEEAEKYFKKSIELDSTFTSGYNALGVFYNYIHRYDQAEKYTKKVIELDSTNWVAYANLGLLYQRKALERWEESAAMTLKSIELSPPMGKLAARLGNAYTHLPGKMEVAKKELDKALEMAPDFPDTYVYLAQWSIKNNQLEEAWQYFEQGLEKGAGKGSVTVEDLQEGADFAEMRKTARWGELMLKYFPEQIKE